MGVESEFDAIFDLLDARQKSYIEYDEILDFYQAFYFMPVARDQVYEAIKHVCGQEADGRCRKNQFLDLVVELERRRQVEQGSWWDFKALDTKDADRISVKEGLFLMKATHQEHFTSITWQTFLETRSHPHEDISYAEIRMWLCNWPLHGSSCAYDEVIAMGEKLDKEKKKQDMQRRKKVMNLEDDFIKAIEAQEKQQYSNKFRNEAKRKLNRWVQLGVESLLFDDGYDAFEGDGTQRNAVSVQDLMEAMEEKYDILREKLLWEATQKHVGESIWSSMRESEREEQVLRVKTKETEYRVKGDFEKITQLSVSYQLYNNTLISMMGYERLAHLKYLKELQDKEKQMKADGKTAEDMYQIFAAEHMQNTQGRATAGQLLIDLHKRHVTERDFVLSLLKGSQGRPLFAAEMVTEYVHYVTQQLIAAWEPAQLEYSAMAMGISERTQDLKSSCYDYDRDLHELLGLHRLHQDGASKRPDKPSGEHYPMEGRNRGIVDLQVEIMRAVLRKQIHERMMMTYMLQGKESTAWRAAASRRPTREAREQRINELRVVCSNWRQSPIEFIRAKQNAHIKMLLEGTWLYHANKQLDIRGGHNLTLTQVSANVMADVQQHHSRELERILLEMQHKSSKDLMAIWRREYSGLNEEYLDGISAVILGTFELSFEELEIVAALEAKYDVLRDKLMMESLIKQYGEAEWKKMSEGDRQRLLIKLKLEERRLRQEGKFDQAAKLLGDSVKDKEALQKLMGKNREEFQKKLQQRLMEREKRKAMGLDSDAESDTEMQEEEAKKGNILKDLQNRHDEELNAIMMLLRQQQNQYLSERERQELLLRLRRERRRAAKESNFDEAAILLGLAERNKANMEEKLKAERERQIKLARDRIAARKNKSKQVMDDEFDDPSLPPKGDMEAWRDAVLREMDKKHRAEQELLVTIVMDEGSEDVRDAARKMGKEGRQQRLLYLRSKAEGLNLDKKEEKEENRDILEEAGAIKSILRHRTLQEQLKDGQEEAGQEEVTTTLLADLQEEQEKESEVIMATIFTMNEEQLSRLRMDQIWSRHNEQGTNALVVFTQYEGVGDEDSLLKALDKKYDTLREKILKAALIQRVGEEKWNEMSEEEQHKMLYEVKQQERRLRADGKTSEISQQLGIQVTSEGLKKLMGTERTEYEEKRRQKMELKKRRLSQGLDPIQEGDEDGISEDEDDDEEVDVLTKIQKRQDAEREALIAQLRGVEAQYLNERERQAELARLKREVRKARMEDGFHAAALVLGLAERHQAAADERLKHDRRRQEQLAKQRLEAARKKKRLGTIPEEEEEQLHVVDNGDKAAMQDAVLKMLEIKHEKERAALLRLLQHDFSEDQKFIAENLMNEARAEKQQEIWNQRKQLDISNKEEHYKLLLEAAILKLVSRRKLLESTSSEVTADDVIVSIMADLQLHQDKESETIIQTLPDKELGTLKKLQKESLEAIRTEKHENVAIVITSTDLGNKADENQLVEALEAKYDTLKDKLLADALMKQMGEGEWARLSERERQLRLMKLKLEERRLRQEGKMDEAAALLGDALKSQSALEALMGDSRKAQEEKLRLRLEKRKQRLAEGMSEEDVDRLEEEEIKQEEEELKKKRKNILLDLDNRLEDEKAALLAALRGQGDRLQSERERQAELARLRREQRKARHEDKFEAAALVMGLAQKADDAKENDRKRQEQLAKERLEQRRRLKAAAKEGKEETVTPVMLPENENDKQGLQEAVIQEMEMKHSTERDFLMQLVQDENQGDLRKSASLMSEDKRQLRLGELKEQRRQWRESGPTKETEDEQTDILRKGVAVLLESRLLEMKTSKGEEVTDGDVEVSLIADLQEKQDKEATYLMDDLESKSAMTLKQLKQVQFIARANGWNDNVAATVLVTKADTEKITEEQLLKALENKYDVMRDKLMAEALIKQTGQAEWAKLSERERQARLMKLRLQERKLRQENKFDEANTLLSQGIKDQAELSRLIGATRSEQEEKLKQRLERKKQLKDEREAQGLEASDEVLDEIVKHEESRKEVLEDRKKRPNILEGLNNHFEDEKNALLAALRGQDDSLQGEKERQLALAKLRRDQRKLQDEEKFEAAATLFGLAQQHEKAREANYEKDKERQKQLARERLAARRAKMAADKSGQTEHLTRSEIQEQLMQEEKENAKADAAHATKTDPVSLVSMVMDEVDKKQSGERDVLVTLVDGAMANSKERTRLEELALKDLLAQLEALKEERRQLREDADLEFGDVDVSKLSEEELSRHLTQVSEYQEQQHRLLKSAISLKIEMMRRSLIQENRLSYEEIEEELTVMMLSELQQKQSVETNAVHTVLEGFPGGSSRPHGPPGSLEKRHSMASIAAGVGHSFKEIFYSESTQETKSEEFLYQMKSTQRRARREGWLDNVAVTVFDHTTITLEMTTEIEEMTKRIQAREGALLTLEKELEEKKAAIRKNGDGKKAEELDAMIAKLEQEYANRKKALEEEQAKERRQEAEMKEVNQELEQKERDLEKLDQEMQEAIENERKRRPSEAYDADAMMAEIEAQFDAKKRAMQAQLEKQRRQAMEKIAARKQRLEDRDYEDEMAVALIHAAEKSKTQKEEAAVEQKNKQNQLMQDRLAARREQRRKAAEERAEAERLAQEEQKKREVSFEQEASKKKVNFGAEPEPGPGLMREKTVVDVDMSEDEKQHLSKMLLSHHSNAQWKLEKEREKRAKELKERLEMRKTRIQDAATTILGLGERQKTMVENKKKDERERQIAIVKERVQRVRYERTQTMKVKGDGKKQFSDYLEKDESGLTEDEKMMKIADRINSQFKRDESSYRAGHKSAFTPDDDELASNSSGSKPSTPQGRTRPKTGRLLGQKERERLIKSRQAKRREIKKVNNSISAAPDMDSLAKMIEDRKKAGMEQQEEDDGGSVV